MPVQFQANLDLARGPAGAAPGRNPLDVRTLWERTWDFGGAVKQFCSKPLLIMGKNVNYFSSSPQGPSDALRRIDEISARGIQRAKTRGVNLGPVAGRFHAELDQILGADKRGVVRRDPIPAAGPVAVIPTLPPDREVTVAVPLQARVDATDWKKEMVDEGNNLAHNLSALTALMIMRDQCGIEEENNLELLKIVEKATRKDSTETLWELFTTHKNQKGELVYDLTLSQKSKAGWIYWSCYQTSLINNVVESYLETFIKDMTKGLTDDDSQMRFKLLRKLLENTNEFLIEDIGATKAFAFAMEPDGDVEKYRRRAIERHYGNSLEELCKAFSKAVVNEDYKVPVFRKFQSIPILGLFFQVFEWLVNRFIIQRAMKASLLPRVLKSAVKSGIEATESHNLSFKLELTRFLNMQMENLRTQLEDTSSPSTPPPQLPGTEILSATIKNLKLVLDLEKFNTQPEFRRKLQEIENGKGVLDQTIQGYIEDGIKEACHYLFDHLNKTAKSRELFANLLRLSCAAFSGQARDQAVLMAEFKEEQLKLKRSAGDLFRKIIHDVVAKKVSGTKPEDLKKTAKEAFDDGQTVAKKTFDQLKQLCERMTVKIDQSALAPTPENTVQPDIAEFLQFMQVYANRKEIQDRVNNLQEVDRDAIWRLITPLYERAAKLQQRILSLQEHQDHHTAHSDVANKLKFIKELIESVRNQFHAQPRHLRNPLIQTLGKTAEEISRWLGAEALGAVRLQGYIKSISDLSESIAREQQVIDALHAFYPPRVAGQAVEQEGLLEQLLSYERGVHPRGFQPRVCLAEISKYLDFFPPEEKRRLRALIDNGSNLRAKWAELSLALQGIYEGHKEIIDNDSARLDETLRTTEVWTEDKIDKYTRLKNENHTQLQKEMREISTDVLHLRNDSYRAQLDLPIYLTTDQTKMATAAAGAGLGLSLVRVGGFLGTISKALGLGQGLFLGPLGAAIGAGAGTLLYTGVQNLSGIYDKKPKAIQSAALSAAMGTAASYAASAVGIPFAPALVGMGAGALTGWNYQEAAHSNAQDKILPEVMDWFENAYKLSLASRVYLGATTRAMKTLSSEVEPVGG